MKEKCLLSPITPIQISLLWTTILLFVVYIMYFSNHQLCHYFTAGPSFLTGLPEVSHSWLSANRMGAIF